MKVDWDLVISGMDGALFGASGEGCLVCLCVWPLLKSSIPLLLDYGEDRGDSSGRFGVIGS